MTCNRMARNRMSRDRPTREGTSWYGRGLTTGKPPLGFLFGFAFGFGFMRTARVLLALALFGGQPLGTLARLPFLTRFGLYLGTAAILIFTLFRSRKGPRARLLLFISQCPQNDASGRARYGGLCPPLRRPLPLLRAAR